MKDEKFRLRAAVYLILLNEGKILLSRRYNTGWEDGKYSLVAGHLDGGETVAQAVVREAKEEAGIDIEKLDVKIVHTMHRLSESGLEYIDFFATTSKWLETPTNLELNKCDDLGWFPLNELPQNLLNHVKQAISMYQTDTAFSHYGWGSMH